MIEIWEKLFSTENIELGLELMMNQPMFVIRYIGHGLSVVLGFWITGKTIKLIKNGRTGK